VAGVRKRSLSPPPTGFKEEHNDNNNAEGLTKRMQDLNAMIPDGIRPTEALIDELSQSRKSDIAEEEFSGRNHLKRD